LLADLVIGSLNLWEKIKEGAATLWAALKTEFQRGVVEISGIVQGAGAGLGNLVPEVKPDLKPYSDAIDENNKSLAQWKASNKDAADAAREFIK